MQECNAGARSAMATSCRDYDPATDRWLAIARLRFVPDAQLDPKAAARRRREYQRRLRRFLYAGSDAVMLEGVVERKSWLHEALSDLMVLVWHGESEDAARTKAALRISRDSNDNWRSRTRACRTTGACGWRSPAPRSTTATRTAIAASGCDCVTWWAGCWLRRREWPLARREAYSAPTGGASGGS